MRLEGASDRPILSFGCENRNELSRSEFGHKQHLGDSTFGNHPSNMAEDGLLKLLTWVAKASEEAAPCRFRPMHIKV
jgi:hypothetical protein